MPRSQRVNGDQEAAAGYVHEEISLRRAPPPLLHLNRHRAPLQGRLFLECARRQRPPRIPFLAKEARRFLLGQDLQAGELLLEAIRTGDVVEVRAPVSSDWRANEDIAVEVVDTYVRATLGDQLIQVASSDRHAGKPWLPARLDSSPPVADTASQGFTLVSARIDCVQRRSLATLD